MANVQRNLFETLLAQEPIKTCCSEFVFQEKSAETQLIFLLQLDTTNFSIGWTFGFDYKPWLCQKN